MMIRIDTERSVYAAALGRQGDISGNPWAQLWALGQRAGPVVFATLYDDAGGPIERLVVKGSKFDRDVGDKIRAFVAEFPEAEIRDHTTITAGARKQ